MLSLYTIFHLNLAYSSIEEEDRKEVIDKCYWPLLNLAKHHGVPIGLEATAFTLEEINRIDPNWVKTLAKLWAEGAVEFIGSGYCQMIAPLVPAKLNRKNLSLGHDIYQKLLGKKPDIALINEQSFSSSLIPLYKDAGFKALVIDWADAASHHPEWDANLGQQPQQALCPDGSVIDIIWSDATSFQKVQRYNHGEVSKADCIEFLENIPEGDNASLCLYGSDAETFNYRPGRYKSEVDLAETDEWQRFADLFDEIKNHADLTVCLPSQVLDSTKSSNKNALEITTSDSTISVKKQRKYNIARWAVTGRSDITINTTCQKIYEQIEHNGSAEQWKNLCFLWSSDFRTHIGDVRWQKLITDLAKNLQPSEKAKPTKHELLDHVKLPSGFNYWLKNNFIILQTPSSALRLNTYRGISIDRFSPNPQDAVNWMENQHQDFWLGTLTHCFYKDVQWGADYYSGHLTLDLPGKHKVTDLQKCTTELRFDLDNNNFIIHADINTSHGNIGKTITLNGNGAKLSVKYDLDDDLFRVGSLRLGNFTINPQMFDRNSLYFSTHNGGESIENHSLSDAQANHGKIISTLISSSFGLGMTEGEMNIGDDEKQVKISFNRSASCFLGMINCQDVKDTYFCRASLSMIEMDDTSRPFDKELFNLLPKPEPEISISLIKK